jgi:hypothetical protein
MLNQHENLLQEQFDLYEKQADRLDDAWKIQHAEVRICWAVEDAIAFGLTVLNGLRRRTDSWSRAVERGEAFSWDDARVDDEQYSRWLKQSTLVLRAAKFCEENHYDVTGVDNFRSAVLDVSLMDLDTTQVRDAIAELQSGGGVPARQAMDELRDRLQQERA